MCTVSLDKILVCDPSYSTQEVLSCVVCLSEFFLVSWE